MNIELQQTMELARALDGHLAFYEKHQPTLPVVRAAKRMREAIVDGLRKAVEELKGAWPADSEAAIDRFIQSLERGVIPRQAQPKKEHLVRS